MQSACWLRLIDARQSSLAISIDYLENLNSAIRVENLNATTLYLTKMENGFESACTLK